MSLVNGVNMTPYSDDTILSYLIAAHEHIMGESEWAEMMVWRPRVLSGVDGLVTELITDADNWKNIARIYHELYADADACADELRESAIRHVTCQGIADCHRRGPRHRCNTSSSSLLHLIYMNVLFQLHLARDIPTTRSCFPWWWLHVYYAS
jgi:hypothetical protein